MYLFFSHHQVMLVGKEAARRSPGTLVVSRRRVLVTRFHYPPGLDFALTPPPQTARPILARGGAAALQT